MGNNDLKQLADLSINTIRFLAIDAIQGAKSGHPGLPMGGAAMAYTLWTRHLKHNPANPGWIDRDRFILSAGHGSMLLYALLHLTGYDLSIDDIKAFRVLGSKAPGHPEFGETPGVEVTTGPLGQGIADAVGMAIAEAHLAAVYNRHDARVVDHYTYAIVGDGDLMEGISYEACSIAGHLGLGKLILLYDDNQISLAGETGLCFTEDVKKRFESCGWQVQQIEDGNDVEAIDQAIVRAKEDTAHPSIIAVRTVIGYGSPAKQGTASCHGSPLGSDEVVATRCNLCWPSEPFFVPKEVKAHMGGCVDRGKAQEAAWRSVLEKYGKTYPESASEFERIQSGNLPADWEKKLPRFDGEQKPVSTRKVSETVLQALAPVLPELIGGSADLNPSTLTWLKGFGDFQATGTTGSKDVQGAVGKEWSYAGRNLHFGVREHAMAAIANGMVLHRGIIPFVGTFFVFSDYMRPSIRLAALMGAQVIYVLTHDSIGVGEDGPTHQPVEHLMSLRVMPGLTVIRPADANEAVEAWRMALVNDNGPTALVFSRQDIPVIDRSTCSPAGGLRRGGYVLWESSKGTPEVILIGTGSEMQLALDAGKILSEKDGAAVRVVSLPCWELFDTQPESYREEVLPSSVKAIVAVEAGIRMGWERYTGRKGAIIGMDGFGASAPAPILYEKFSITVQHIVDEARRLMPVKA